MKWKLILLCTLSWCQIINMHATGFQLWFHGLILSPKNYMALWSHITFKQCPLPKLKYIYSYIVTGSFGKLKKNTIWSMHPFPLICNWCTTLHFCQKKKYTLTINQAPLIFPFICSMHDTSNSGYISHSLQFPLPREPISPSHPSQSSSTHLHHLT